MSTSRSRSSPTSSSSAALELGTRASAAAGARVSSAPCLRSSICRAPELVDGAVLRRRHQPGAGIVRDARLRPALERRHERLLRQILGEADVAHHANQPADQPRRLDAPDRLDGLARGRLGRRATSHRATTRFCRSISARSRSSCARSSGVSSLPKSSASKTGRISTSTPPSNGAALEPLDRLVHRLDLPDPVAGDELLGLGERAVDDGALRAREADALALRRSAAARRRRA